MSTRPNFLVIMADQHAPGVFSGLGHPAVRTPCLDRLMSAGITFRQAYCPYPMCTPARAGFMTGLLTPQHGVWELGTPLRSDLPTWAHVLRRVGYQTVISGRMHFVGHDKLHGFAHRVHGDMDKLLTPFAYGDWDAPEKDEHVMPPRCEQAGAFCDAPVSLIDWMPTFLALTGQDACFGALSGRSLLPLFQDPAERWSDRAIVADYACKGTRVPMRMVRSGPWKACFAWNAPAVLFDLRNDPYEWHDLGSQPASQEVLESLRAMACSDGWDPALLRDEIWRHQRRLKYISEAELVQKK